MRNDSVSVGIDYTLIVIVVFVGALGLFLWGAKGLLKRLFRGKGPKGADTELPPAPARATTPAWVWLVLILGFGLVFWQFTPRKTERNRPAASGYGMRALVIAGAVGAVGGGAVVLFLVLRAFDPGILRAQKRANAGDREGAIEDLREQIELKGATQDRVNALGMLLMNAERWDEAAAHFRKAEELGTVKGVCRANLGLALLKGGKPEEALPVLREAARTTPAIPAIACLVGLHSALALAALGRWDEAREQYRQVEAALPTVPRAQRASIQNEIELARWIERGPQVAAEPPPSVGG